MSYADSFSSQSFPPQEGHSSQQPPLAYMVRDGASAAMIPPDVLVMIDEAKHNGWGAQFAGWMSAHTGRLVLFIVILVGVTGIFLSVRTHPALSPTYEENALERAQTNSAGGIQLAPGNVSLDASDVAMGGEVITEAARRGEGITHLARRAMAARIAESDIHLSKEQLIYAEDYVQNAIGAHALDVGEKLSFAQELLDEAASAALALSSEQIGRLSAYAARVTWNID